MPAPAPSSPAPAATRRTTGAARHASQHGAEDRQSSQGGEHPGQPGAEIPAGLRRIRRRQAVGVFGGLPLGAPAAGSTQLHQGQEELALQVSRRRHPWPRSAPASSRSRRRKATCRAPRSRSMSWAGRPTGSAAFSSSRKTSRGSPSSVADDADVHVRLPEHVPAGLGRLRLPGGEVGHVGHRNHLRASTALSAAATKEPSRGCSRSSEVWLRKHRPHPCSHAGSLREVRSPAVEWLVRELAAEETHALRRAVSADGRTEPSPRCATSWTPRRAPGTWAPSTRPVTSVAISSLLSPSPARLRPEAMPGVQLNFMAVEPALQRRAADSAVMAEAIRRPQGDRRGPPVGRGARDVAVPFYERFGLHDHRWQRGPPLARPSGPTG